ncbi:MAG TPA: response regulator [Phenylobacterium sp.]|nr:response regulator [Phenylobacterium sp.]
MIEGDICTSNFLSKALREQGFAVEQVADGRDGLYLAASSAFDAIVMNRTLPGLGGLWVVKALRAAAVETPILMLSTLSHLDERLTGLKAGADDYLTKPYGFSELKVRLENLIRRRCPVARRNRICLAAI